MVPGPVPGGPQTEGRGVPKLITGGPQPGARGSPNRRPGVRSPPQPGARRSPALPSGPVSPSRPVPPGRALPGGGRSGAAVPPPRPPCFPSARPARRPLEPPGGRPRPGPALPGPARPGGRPPPPVGGLSPLAAASSVTGSSGRPWPSNRERLSCGVASSGLHAAAPSVDASLSGAADRRPVGLVS